MLYNIIIVICYICMGIWVVIYGIVVSFSFVFYVVYLILRNMFVNYVNYIINSVIVVLKCCRIVKYFDLCCIWECGGDIVIWIYSRYIRYI